MTDGVATLERIIRDALATAYGKASWDEMTAREKIEAMDAVREAVDEDIAAMKSERAT